MYNIAWSGANRWLLAGTAAGLVGWNINDDKVKKQGKDYRYTSASDEFYISTLVITSVSHSANFVYFCKFM